MHILTAIMKQGFKTTVLLAGLTAIILYIGHMMGGSLGVILALAIALVFNFGAYWYSDRIVLAMYRAQPLTSEQAPDLYRIMEDLTSKANVPMPRLFLIPNEHPNAFATGRNPKHAVIAVTQGILRLLNYEELKGVLAHELGHVYNRDTLISTIAATLAGVITHLAFMARWVAIFGGVGDRDNNNGGILGLLLTAIVAPIAAVLIQLAISRSREYLADETGAKLAGHPMGLIGALEKLDYAGKRIPLNHGNLATSHLFIVNPFHSGLSKLFSTHPLLKTRIDRLKKMI